MRNLTDEPTEAPPPTTNSSSPPTFVDGVLMALRFYSRLPTGRRPHLPPNLSRIATTLPLASLIIGVPPALLLYAASFTGLAGLFAASLAVALQVIVTGAMAEDALADAADGLFGGHTPERRLEIMKDSRHGTYGVAALCLLLLLRVAGLAALAGASPLTAALAFVAATTLARSGALWLMLALGPARKTGIAAGAGRPTASAFAVGLGIAVMVSVVLAVLAHSALGLIVALPLTALVAAGWTALCRRLVGGQTGDLAGALQALLELAVLGSFLACR